jgi:hypothetical protein
LALAPRRNQCVVLTEPLYGLLRESATLWYLGTRVSLWSIAEKGPVDFADGGEPTGLVPREA